MKYKFAAFLLLLSSPALAHQPVVVAGTGYPLDAPFEVGQPEVSKAYFGKLDGKPEYFRIVSESSFRFYAGISTPKVDDCPFTRFSFDVLDSALGQIATGNGEAYEWWPWYEHFGQKWYWIGPEIGVGFKSDRTFGPGTYYIRVFNGENSGRYVLATGDVESFPVDVIVKTIITMPTINREFWPTCHDVAPDADTERPSADADN